MRSDNPPDMTNNAPQQFQVSPSSVVRNRRPMLVSLVLLAVIIVAAGLAVWRTHDSKSAKKAASPAGFSSYSLPGQGNGAGRGMAFLKPDNVTIDSNTTNLPAGQVGMLSVSDTRTNVYIAAASPVKSSGDYASINKSAVSSAMSDPTGDDYSTYSNQPEFFAMGVLPDETINYGPAKPFTNPNISSNAWQMDMDLTSHTDGQTAKGTLVYVLGKNGYYYFLLDADSAYWQSHGQDWQAILNSIQVDQ